MTSWSGDANGTDESFKIFPTADTRVSANFSYTGRFYSEDDFNSADLTGGVGWAGDWVLDNLMEYLTNPANTTIRLYANSQITRSLAVPVNNAVLEFKRDLDKLDNDDGDSVRAEVYDGLWHTVWEIGGASANGDHKALWQESIDLGAYGTVSKIRFTTEIESGESMWLDNVRIAGYNASVSNDQCYFTADPISAPNGSAAAPYIGSIASDAIDPDSDPLTFTNNRNDLDPDGRMARVLVEVEDPLGLIPANANRPRLLLGAYVTVDLVGYRMPDSFIIRRESLRHSNCVWLRRPDSTLEIRPVTVLWKNRDTVVIGEGLEAGEQLITSSLSFASDGMKVTVTAEAKLRS